MEDGEFVSWMQGNERKKSLLPLQLGSALHQDMREVMIPIQQSFPQMSFLKESVKYSQKAEGSLCNNRQTGSQASPHQLSGLSPEQFHCKLQWDLWKVRRALLNASFLHHLSQRGIHNWFKIAWFFQNTKETFLKLFHKYHLQSHRDKTLLSHSRSYFRLRSVS